MVQLAANLTLLFNELPFLDRFAAARDAGFQAVEFLFPYEVPAEVLADRLQGLQLALFNMPAGDWDAGERGLAVFPDRVEECRRGVRLALDYARALGCERVHLMAGKPAGLEPAVARGTLIDNIRYAADLAAPDGVQILLEPLNSHVDMPGYFYSTSAAAMSVIAEADRANVKLQYDVYHMQIMEGHLALTIERLLPHIGHIQIADNPGRGEPGTGEINYPWLLQHLDALGYAGFVGCEYRPVRTTLDGLGWAAPYLGQAG